jgi:hypothetical protein
MMHAHYGHSRWIRKALILLVLSGPFTLQAQWQSIYSTNTNVSLTPPSPNAASFQKYGLTPVAYNSGVPNISIPVYEVKAGDLSMPITLSYHSNGMKPKEEASWTGLGWNLNAGGVITRIKKGAVDGTRPYGRNFDQISPYDSAMNLYNPDPANDAYAFQTFFYNVYFSQYYDTEPDIFVFNFFGHQGKFLFINGQPYFIEYEKWKVYKYSDDQGFYITDENGTQYQFTTAEYTRSRNPSKEDPLDPPQGWASAWQLTRVVSADQKHWMQFAYTPYTYNELNTVQSQLYKVSYGEPEPNFPNICQPNAFPGQVNTNAPVGNAIAGQGLTSIVTSEQQTISFVQYPWARKDMSSTQNALQQVVVRGQAGNPDTVIERTAFQYGYFGDSTNLTYARLKLSGIYSLCGAGDTLNFHTFEYAHETDGFPSKSTVAIDQWGYYNTYDLSVSDASLVQDVPVQTSMYGTKTTIIYPPPNSTAPNTDYASYGMLSKVHYPTGGYSSYAYEQNRYSYYNNVSLPTLVNVDTGFSTQLFYVAPQNGGHIDSTAGGFVVNTTTNATLVTTRSIWDSLSYPLKTFKPILVLYRITNPDQCGNDNIIPPIPCTYETVYTAPLMYTDSVTQDVVTLQPGRYFYKVYCESSSFLVQAVFNFGVVHYTQYTDANSPVAPGLRIASITDYANTTDLQPSMMRSYTYLDSTGRCTGSLQELPKYQYYVTYETGCPEVVYNQSSDNNGLYNANLQFQFYYTGVRETTAPSQTNSYYTDHYFSPILILSKYITQPVYQGLSAVGYSIPPGFATMENLVLSDPVEVLTVDWVKTMTGYQKIKSVASGFNLVEDTSFTGLRPISLTDATLQNAWIPRTAWAFDAYTLHCLWRYPASKQETDYDTTGNSYTITTNYTYDPYRRNLLRQEETVNNGKTIITKYKYPDTYELIGDISALADNNVLSPVVETQVWQKLATDSSVIRGVVNDFDPVALKPSVRYFLFTSQPLRGMDNEQQMDPPLYSTLIDDSHYREKLRFLYDGRSNIIQTTLDSGMNVPSSYVWGYHYLYPVAKLVGAHFSDVLTKIDTAAIQSITDDAALRSALAPLRTIPGSQVTIYTYTPFVGPTSETDFNGRTTYYEYDAFNRLQNIKDFQFNILKNYFYNYALHPTAPPMPPVTMVPITAANTAGVAGFTAVYTNTATGQQYSFSIAANGGALGSIPAGNYNLTISATGNPTPYDFGLNCGGLLISGLSASFSNVSINPDSCDGIILTNPN